MAAHHEAEAKGMVAGLQLQLADSKRQLMLKDEEIQTLTKEMQTLRNLSHGSSKSSALSIFSKGSKKPAQSHELEALHQMEAQLEPLKKDIRRLQEENVGLRSKLACQSEWSTRDEYVNGLQEEVRFLKQSVEQEKAKFEKKDADFTRLLEETMERSGKDMEEMNRLMEQVARLSAAKKQADDAARELGEAQKQIRRLEDEVAFLTAASLAAPAPGSPTAAAADADTPGEAGELSPTAAGSQHQVLAKWRAELQNLEAVVQQKDAQLAEQQAELTLLREAKAKNATRIEELEGKQRASRQEVQNLVKVVKDLQSTAAALTHSSKALEADLATARATNLERAGQLEERAAELRALREDLRADGQRWVRETVVEGWLVGSMERKIAFAERTRLEAQAKRLEHALRDKTEECETLAGRLDDLQEEALQLMQQTRRESSSNSQTKSPREKHGIFDEAGKPFKSLGKNFSKLKLKDKGKEDIQEMKRLVQETLQRNMELEAENQWLRDHARNRPA